MTTRLSRLVGLAGLVATLCAPPAQARLGLTTGFSADPVLTSGAAATRAVWIGRAVSEGAGMVRINLIWSKVAPAQRPAGFDPTDPASPGYDWTTIDAAVRDLAGRGLKVLMNVSSAPGWAEGPDRPAIEASGSWRPSATELARFTTAAATRFDGRFPDPLRPGAALPRVQFWQAWNEPNLDLYLSPQWVSTTHGYAAVSPGLYRDLLNAFYAAVKGVSSSDFVVTAGTAPYGDQPGSDPPGSERTPPVAFDRDLFCLTGAHRLKPVPCPDPPHLDALSHHPYAIGGPLWHAVNADDAAVADMYKIANVLNAARRTGHVLPRGPKQLWDTEISWDSRPPDPQGVPLQRQARWVEQAMYELWHQGVSTVLWLQIVDAPPVPSYGATYQAGMYFLSGQPKPAAEALRFPFVTRRLAPGTVQAWGRAPTGGELAIQGLRGHAWRTLRSLHVHRHQVFATTLRLRGGATLRGAIGPEASLTWRQS